MLLVKMARPPLSRELPAHLPAEALYSLGAILYLANSAHFG
jgi:hypothetical protein